MPLRSSLSDESSTATDSADSADSTSTDSAVRLHRLDLVHAHGSARIIIGGEVDVLAAGSIERALACLRQLPATIVVDLSACTFMDTAGLKPLVDATRDRRRRALPPVRIEARSPAVDRLLGPAGLGGDPFLDLDAWDALAVA